MIQTKDSEETTRRGRERKVGVKRYRKKISRIRQEHEEDQHLIQYLQHGG